MALQRMLAVCLIAGLIAGCGMSSQRINSLKLGMTKADVIREMGDPNYVAAKGDVEVLSYRLATELLFTDEYIVHINNGRVDFFGQRYDFSAP